MFAPKPIKICFTGSAGGHMSQLLKLANCWEDHSTFCVTTSELIRKKLQRYGKIYVVGACNRQHPVQVLKVLAKCVRIIIIEKPDVIISTGAAVGCIICFLSKLQGAKIIWLDSITNVEHLSLSGRIIRYVADLFLVQWPDLIEQYKNIEYAGSVI